MLYKHTDMFFIKFIFFAFYETDDFLLSYYIIYLFIHSITHYNNMAKKEMTWRELVTLKMKERRAKGEKPSLTDVAPEAQKDWKAIKDGSHPDYVQGKATFNKSKKNKSTKMKKGRMAATTRKNGKTQDLPAAEEIIANCKLCAKCSKKVRKVYGNKKGNVKKGNSGDNDDMDADDADDKTGGSHGTTTSVEQSQPASVADSSKPSLLNEESVTLHAGGSNKK